MVVSTLEDSGSFIISSHFLLLLTYLLCNHNNDNNSNTEDVFSAGPCSKYIMSLNVVDANNTSWKGGLILQKCTGRGHMASGWQHQDNNPRALQQRWETP